MASDAILTYCSTWRTLVEIAEYFPFGAGIVVAKMLRDGQLERRERHPRGGGTIFEYRTVT